MNPTVATWMNQYAADHRHPMNRLTHKIAIPFIVFHIMTMLDWLKTGQEIGGVAITGGIIGFVVAMLFYAWADLKMAPLMALLFGAALFLGRQFGDNHTPVIVIAVVGWTVQLIGHAVYEKNRPSLLTNALQALVGPYFFVSVLTGRFKPNYQSAS